MTYLKEYQHSIIKPLVYFDVFNFPLNEDELFLYSNGASMSRSELQEHLAALLDKRTVYQLGDFYALQDDKAMVEIRKEGELRASKAKKNAEKKARLIGRFPFVRGVLISGSYSKGILGKDGDIDFFIITEPNRLWVARTLLVFYKKAILLNSRKYFCINYFIDSENLQIEEKNRFTATEIITLMPMVNAELYEQFYANNDWVLDYYPQADRLETNNTQQLKKRRLGRFMEWLLADRFGEWLDTRFMHMTFKRWQRKFGHMTDENFTIAMKTSRRISKHHPSNFQSRVLNQYQQKLQSIENLI